MEQDVVTRSDRDPTVRIEAKFKNARLYRAIEEMSTPLTNRGMGRFGPVSAFCKLHGLSYAAVCGLLNLRMKPVVRHQSGETKVRTICHQLADICCLTVEYLFPPKLYEIEWPRNAVSEVSHGRFMALSCVPSEALMVPPVQLETVSNRELKGVLDQVLQTLTPRETQVIEWRYGLNDYPHSLDDVAQRIGVSRERVRQIEAKAIRKLRHPSRSRHLRPFVSFYEATPATPQQTAPKEPDVPAGKKPEIASVDMTMLLGMIGDSDDVKVVGKSEHYDVPLVLERGRSIGTATIAPHGNHGTIMATLRIRNPNLLVKPRYWPSLGCGFATPDVADIRLVSLCSAAHMDERIAPIRVEDGRIAYSLAGTDMINPPTGPIGAMGEPGEPSR